MTKPKDTLGEQCALMAARAAWWLRGKEGPPPAEPAVTDVALYMEAMAEQEGPRASVGRFGMQRWTDWRRDTGCKSTPPVDNPALQAHTGKRRDLERAREQAKAATVQLQRAVVALAAAASAYEASSHAEDQAGPPTTNQWPLVARLRSLADDASAALTELKLVRRSGASSWVHDNAFEPFDGMGEAEWKSKLKEQAAMLRDSGVPELDVATICDWTAISKERTKDNMRRRVPRKKRSPAK